MKDQNSAAGTGEMMLTSPTEAPFSFTIVIKGVWPINNRVSSFQVKGSDRLTGLTKMWRYHFDDRTHETYLDFFDELSKDFGLRVPRNRQPAAERAFHASFHEVLSKNLDSGMLYGYGDPAVIRVEADDVHKEIYYYLLATSNDAADSFPIVRSKNLIDWEFVSYVFPRNQKPAWAADGEEVSDYWAPEMHKIGSEYRVYFVARDKQSRELCIGTARSSQPYGPFIADTVPIIKGNVIDPHIFVREDEIAYLYWKEDNNETWPRLLLDLLYDHPVLIAQLFKETEDQLTASFTVTVWPWARMLEPMERFQALQNFIEAVTSVYQEFYDCLSGLVQRQAADVQERIVVLLHYMKTPMFAQQLSPDGLNLVGEKTKIIENDMTWEAHLVEGMWVTKFGDKYYLFYAGNDFSTDQYGIGVAVAESPLGPYIKMKQQLLQSTDIWWAPGHPSLVIDRNGKPQLFIHAYFPGKAGYKQFRACYLYSWPLKKTEYCWCQILNYEADLYSCALILVWGRSIILTNANNIFIHHVSSVPTSVILGGKN